MENSLNQFKLVSWAALPTMPVYMDQLLELVNQVLAPLNLAPVTKTMVNSYVKQHFFSRPAGRRYTRNHIVAVIVVSILKTDFSLPTISRVILKIRDSRQIELRYAQFDRALQATLQGQPVPVAEDTVQQVIQYAAQTVAFHLLTEQALS